MLGRCPEGSRGVLRPLPVRLPRRARRRILNASQFAIVRRLTVLARKIRTRRVANSHDCSVTLYVSFCELFMTAALGIAARLSGKSVAARQVGLAGPKPIGARAA